MSVVFPYFPCFIFIYMQCDEHSHKIRDPPLTKSDPNWSQEVCNTICKQGYHFQNETEWALKMK